GRVATIDEIDEALIIEDNKTYFLAEGMGASAPNQLAEQVRTFDKHVLAMKSSDFFGRDRIPGEHGGHAALTKAGLETAEQLLGHPPSKDEVNRLNMAAEARWVYK